MNDSLELLTTQRLVYLCEVIQCIYLYHSDAWCICLNRVFFLLQFYFAGWLAYHEIQTGCSQCDSMWEGASLLQTLAYITDATVCHRTESGNYDVQSQGWRDIREWKASHYFCMQCILITLIIQRHEDTACWTVNGHSVPLKTMILSLYVHGYLGWLWISVFNQWNHSFPAVCFKLNYSSNSEMMNLNTEFTEELISWLHMHDMRLSRNMVMLDTAAVWDVWVRSVV